MHNVSNLIKGIYGPNKRQAQGIFRTMARLFFAFFLWISLSTQSLFAQEEVVWIQIEAHPSLSQTEARLRAYAADLPDVNGFALGGGWYGVALGPYARNDAEQVLSVYRAEGTIPSDSYIAFSSAFRQQIWPVGANLLNLPATAPAEAPTQAPQVAATEPTVEPTPEPQFIAPDETLREARASEAALSREEREALQIALKWAGFYDSTIDGAFGRGTRGSMAAWQTANGYEGTGTLTTAQRAALLGQYNAVLNGLGLALVCDEEAGIEMMLPTSVVAFSKYEPPFAHYDATADIQARVLLISQPGDQNTLFGLYDIMQTLEIVPTSGPRERDNRGFMMVGVGADFVSHTQANLVNGEIKGFTLIWPAGDEERRTRLLSEMQKSFTRLPGTIDATMLSEGGQSVDLIAGLEVRKPLSTASGFFTDTKGTVVTSLASVQSCGLITLEDDKAAEVIGTDDANGIAVLRPKDPLAPISVAMLGTSEPRLQSEVAVAGYSFGGLLNAPSLTFGTLSDVKGLNGEETIKRLSVETLPGDVGGPVLDVTGAVLGMLLPTPTGARQLPKDVHFAARSDVVRKALGAIGLAATDATDTSSKAPEDLVTIGTGFTVLVNCWE